ncbi:DUF3575 domain-containing protein [Lacinutrix undariae]
MKKIILMGILMSFSMSLFAQDDTENDDVHKKKNEVKINALFMVIGAFDVTYERLLNEESGVGIELFVPFEEDIREDLKYYISPYYRFYFGEKYAAGFFLEGFGMLNSTVHDTYRFTEGENPILISKTKDEVNFALGIGLGGKWVTKSGFVGELSLGVGRNLLDSDYSDSDLVGKLGVTLGYRF